MEFSVIAEVSAAADPQILLSTRQVAALIGVESSTLAVWRRRGIGPPWYRLQGHLVRYDRVALLVWLRSQAAEKSMDASHLPDNGRRQLD